MSAPSAIRLGPGVSGVPFVKFTLTYDGRLPASANKPKNWAKWGIRSALAPQLRDLWKNHPALRNVWENRHFPKTGGTTLEQVHHLYPGPIEPKAVGLSGGPRPEILDLCEPIEKHGGWFRPLVRENFALHCGLKILFLRREAPGKVYQGGDIDGRIKTLLDALAMPQHVEQVLEKTSTENNPIDCLLEDDLAVSGLSVELERLLSSNEDEPPDFVRLVIEVDVRVRQAMIYNQSFLG